MWDDASSSATVLSNRLQTVHSESATRVTSIDHRPALSPTCVAFALRDRLVCLFVRGMNLRLGRRVLRTDESSTCVNPRQRASREPLSPSFNPGAHWARSRDRAWPRRRPDGAATKQEVLSACRTSRCHQCRKLLPGNAWVAATSSQRQSRMGGPPRPPVDTAVDVDFELQCPRQRSAAT